MKYMLLMQSSGAQADFPPIETWPVEDVMAHIEFMRATGEKLGAAGELVDAQGLAAPDQARIVRAGQGGSPVITDGPYPETKEFLVGYWVVDCESPERAIELAAYVSAAPGPGGRPLNMPIEVRQVMSASPAEEL
ncbi:YciI family protein [Streptosporangium sp. NPDC050855]|uniref:YciI family protein n=1 Tax=Streptosporangium sp. NPDC050855 TaxID=3366194 RepID=UPI00378B6805